MATLLKTDGSLVYIEPSNKKEGFSLKECYKHIGCDTIAVINLPDGKLLIVDEEGLLKRNPRVNRAASLLNPFQTIVGNAIHCTRREFK